MVAITKNGLLTTAVKTVAKVTAAEKEKIAADAKAAKAIKDAEAAKAKAEAAKVAADKAAEAKQLAKLKEAQGLEVAVLRAELIKQEKAAEKKKADDLAALKKSDPKQYAALMKAESKGSPKKLATFGGFMGGGSQSTGMAGLGVGLGRPKDSATVQAAIKAETDANTAEYKAAQGLLSGAGVQSLTKEQLNTKAGTYDATIGAGKNTIDRVTNAVNTVDEYNIAGRSHYDPNGKFRSTVGTALSTVDSQLEAKKTTGSYVQTPLGKVLTRMDTWDAKYQGDLTKLTDKDIATLHKAITGFTDKSVGANKLTGLKPVAGKEGLFEVARPAVRNGLTKIAETKDYYHKNDDGSYSQVILTPPKGIKAVAGMNGVFSYSTPVVSNTASMGFGGGGGYSPGGFMGGGSQSTGMAGLGGGTLGGGAGNLSYIRKNADGTYSNVNPVNGIVPNLKSIAKVAGYDNVYRVIIGDNNGKNQNYTTEYFTKNADGTFDSALVDSYYQKVKSSGGMGFGGFVIGAVVTLATGGAGLGLSAIASGAIGGAVGGGLASGSLEGALKGGLSGALGGALSVPNVGYDAASIAGNISGTLHLSEIATSALETGIKGAVSGAVNTAIGGGDFSDVLAGAVVSGLASGAGSYVGQTANNALTGNGLSDVTNPNSINLPNSAPTVVDSTLSGAAAGATSGAVYSGLTGGSVATGLLAGGAAGAASGAVSNVTGSGTAGSIVGNTVGGLVGSAINSGSSASGATTTPAPEPVVTPAPVTPATNGDMSGFNANYKNRLKPRDFSFQKWGTA